MKLDEVPFLTRDVLQAQVQSEKFKPTDWSAGEVVVRAKDDILLLRQGEKNVTLSITAGSGALLYQAQKRDVIWWMAQPKSNKVGFRYLLPQDVLDEWVGQITVDTRTADTLKQGQHIKNATVPEAIAWLMEEFLLEGAPDATGTVRALSAITNRTVSNQLQWLGRKHTLDIRRDDSGVLWIERVAKRKHDPDQAFALIEGQVGFIDAAQGLMINDADSFQRAQSASSSFGSYLELWQLYGSKEWQRALKQAADIGAFHYTSLASLSEEGGGWRLQGDAKSARNWWVQWCDLAGSDDQVEVRDTAPDWQADHYQDPTAEQPRNTVRGKLSWHKEMMVLETESRELPPKGYVYLSMAGHRTAHKRRIKARQLIESGCGVPSLKTLLQDLPTPTQRLSTLPALTRYARESFHKGKPTDRQVDALHLAVNTPDVALIIGPPGTGKTQVIAALERRLSEDNQGQVIAQQVLISSYQHDAVENALERTDVYGLPAIKVGGSRRSEGADPLQKWCIDKHKLVDGQRDRAIQANPDYAVLAELEVLLATLLVLGATPEIRTAKLDRLEFLLRQLAQTARVRLPSQWWDTWQDIRQESTPSNTPLGGLNEHQRLRCRRQVRALRTCPESFLDDGPQQATYVLAALSVHSGLLTPAHQSLLQQARETSNDPPDSLLQGLAELQKQLLDSLRRNEHSTEQRSRLPESMRLQLKKLDDLLAEKLSTTRLSQAAVLTRYANALQEQPERVRSAVARYSSVVGATCQQAASRQMAFLKQGSEDVLSGLRFDSVVIDEAARANPLDLFVPMALAARRIILVGDPRQLPHLLDSDIEEEIQAERGEQAVSTVYQQSLFERLWRQFEARRADDGFSRVVMLDTQFRMHPKLGAFVSKWFYERPGLGVLKPGREASDFLATVPGFGAAVCAWIDVPHEKGAEERHGTSRRRFAEAQRTAQAVEHLLRDLPESMSLGVITFYAAQRDAIFEALTRIGVAERTEQGLRVVPKYASTPTGEERLRIGTVDAFQGKEFDVVLLSTVRSNRQPVALPDDPTEADAAFERQASGRYGHLRSANRLNVAMSRQRRLLVAVGDEQMFRGVVAEHCVPEMHAFLELCDEETKRG